MLVARRFVVSGRVQGVGFRFFVTDAARREGVHGWVMNRADGCVEAHAEGERDAVERFERQIRRGPPGSRVENVLDEMGQGLSAGSRKRAEANLAKARTRDSLQAFEKLTHVVDGQRRIIGDPPLCLPFAVIIGDDDGFSGVSFDRPKPYPSRLLTIPGFCKDTTEWPWA